ncbi:DUF4142 domain-containing protein [Siccirubricoccus phaeus]|uniref:DUF4142 domain-containing protein n=1 Tax=Siccirubricoccus phaeus TaxID=2595053 RepID=UPI0011F27EC5|nr:DUF4142 domain-containing protein [Siccirubricoccus phaeus]
MTRLALLAAAAALAAMTRLALLAAAAALAALPAAAQTQQQRAQAAQEQNAQSGVPGAHDTTAPGGSPSATGSRAEVTTTEEFLRLVAMGDRYEIASSRLALERTQNPRIRDFAQRMVRDHEKTTAELQRLRPELAATVAPPRGAGPGAAGSSAAGTSTGMAPSPGAGQGGQGAGLDQQHQALLQQLQGAPAARFEQLYLRQQVMAHQQAVDLFRNYAAAGEDANLRQWAAATLPALEEHLRMAQQLQRGT